MTSSVSELRNVCVQLQASIRKSALQATRTKTQAAPTRATYLRKNSGLYDSLIAVLKHLRQDVTALSLAFSGKSITVEAALTQVQKVADHAARLAACVVALPSEGCQIQEWRQDVAEIADRLDKYCKTLIAHCDNPQPQSSAGPSTQSPAPYLVNTSSVWESIDHMIRTSSADEPTAIKKSWQQDRECMDDAFGEFKDLLEDDEGVGEEETFNQDNEWAELEKELNGGGDLDEAEMQRVKKLDTVVRLVLALHKRFSTRLLDIPDLLQLPKQLDLSHAISANFDALVASLYPPQNTKEVKQAADAMIEDAVQLCTLSVQQARVSQGLDLAEQLGDLHMTEGKEIMKEDGPYGSDLKWLSFWQEQMDKACGVWRGTSA
ncbi:hypothetical protein NliqN6_4562 [Naganishia liquefaciens]|uniref:Uncharacterized protein n=1 Tax=Naganishia liquefaciens TaxID=104408 RepID=A0A8H3TVU5_9TREE|nr:hypothetical protein NliqN6_4562 [Naganishia liquefaciens]